MKKLVSLSLFGISALFLVGCGENSLKTEETNSEQIVNAVSESSNETKEDVEEIQLTLNESYTTDEKGNVTISGTSTPGSKIKIGLGIVSKTKANSDGFFELEYSTTSVDTESIKITATKDGKKAKQAITIIPSEQFILASEQKRVEEEAEKKIKDDERTQKILDKENEKPTSSNDKFSAANAEINEHLEQQKGWALGTIDENANPIENGTPNSEYNIWLYVNSVIYNGSNVEVQVTADFKNFTESEKNTIASSSQGMVMTYATLDSLPRVSVKNGDIEYGGSKVLSANNYSWNK